MKILLIEDDPNIRTEVVEWLTMQGYDTSYATNGPEGVHLATTLLPDLVISDIMMPGMTGYEVLRALQSDPTTALIPFIFVSALADRKSVRLGMTLGADDYLTKPFSHDELLDAIETRLTKHATAMKLVAEEFSVPVSSNNLTEEPQRTEPEDSLSLTGTAVRGYQFWEKLGQNSTNSGVYKVYQPSFGREIAVKVLRDNRIQDPEFIHQFMTLTELIANLDHPNIIPIYDYWHDERCIYVAMRLLRPGSLRSIIEEQGSWTPMQTLFLFDQIADALSAAHGIGVVHRDLKPENVLLDERGSVYLSDFGFSRKLPIHPHSTPQEQTASAESTIRSPNRSIDTFTYLSPEQIQLAPLSPQSDIYSVGIILYELLTGLPPFRGTDEEIIHKHLHDELSPAHELHPNVPISLDAVLKKATAKDWQQRYSDIRHFAADFRHAIRK